MLEGESTRGLALAPPGLPAPGPSLHRGIRFEVRSRDPWSLPPDQGTRFEVEGDCREWRARLGPSRLALIVLRASN